MNSLFDSTRFSRPRKSSRIISDNTNKIAQFQEDGVYGQDSARQVRVLLPCARSYPGGQQGCSGSRIRLRNNQQVIGANTRHLIAAEKRWRESTAAKETCGTFSCRASPSATRFAPHRWSSTIILKERHRASKKIYSWKSFGGTAFHCCRF